jgi:capsular polysaccharide biosynthesis protein
MSQRVETRRVLSGVRRRWFLVLLLTVVGAVLGYAVASRAEPVYQASTSILVGQPFQTPNLTKDNLEVGQQVALTYADLIQREPVLGPVVKNLSLNIGWNQLSKRVKASPAAQNPQLIVVTVNADSPQTATDIATEIGKQAVALSPGESDTEVTDTRSFVASRLTALQDAITAQQNRLDQLQSSLKTAKDKRARTSIGRQINNEQRLLIASQQSYASLGAFLTSQQVPNSLQVLEPAQASGNPVNANTPFDTVLGGLIGFSLGIGLAYILEFRRRDRYEFDVQSSGEGGEMAYSGGYDAPVEPHRTAAVPSTARGPNPTQESG